MIAMQAFVLGYLLNSLWQVPLVFAAAWLAARIVRRSGPATEHRIWVSAALLQAVLPACAPRSHGFLPRLLQEISWIWLTRPSRATTRITILSGAGYTHRSSALPPHLLAAIGFAGAGSIAYFAARLLWSLVQTAAMRRNAKPVIFRGPEAAIWARCLSQFRLRHVEIAASDALSSPVTLGIRSHVLLLPAAMPADLLPQDLSAALAHECAHMQRHDFAKNLVYTVVTLPIAFHPLVWLTRVRLAETREMVCDSMAAEFVAGPRTYAHSLLRLATLFAQSRPGETLNAIGIFDANNLEKRVMNLTRKQIQLYGASRLAAVAACIALALGTCASAVALRVDVATPALQNQPAAGAQNSSAEHVPGGVINGLRQNFVQPIYPAKAKADGVQGSVVLKALIGKDGRIANLDVVSGPPELAQAAVAAVKQWTYKPYLHDGVPTEVDTTITVNFSLNTGKSPATGHATSSSEGSSPIADASSSAEPTHPVFLSGPSPQYPPAARREKNTADESVVVSLVVDQHGVPSHVAVVNSSRQDFDESALRAVQQYRFKPAILDGRPVDYPLTVEVRFQKF